MNRAIVIAIAGILGTGAAIGAYRSGLIGPQYARVVRSTPITVVEPVYADVIDSVPVTKTTMVPQQVCTDREVKVRERERFGNKDGALAGALVGGLLGNQVGKGDGRKAATVAGLVGGGLVGRNIDRKHDGGRVTTRNERSCREETREQVSTIGYDVHYQVDGLSRTLRVDSRPSDQVRLGERTRVIGYDVDWKYRDQTGTVRMDDKPGERLPMRDGAVVVSDGDPGPGKG